MGRRIDKRMKKYIWFALLLLVLGVAKPKPLRVLAREDIHIEQTQETAPELKVYMQGVKETDTGLEARITGDALPDGIVLKQSGEIEKFSKSGEGIHYMILFDNSGSVDEKQFKEVKNQLIQMRKTLGKRDSMTLWTVGCKDKSNGNPQKIVPTQKGDKKSDIKAIKNIKRFNTKKSGTLLYDALTQRLQEADNKKKRTVILLLTDGEDDSQKPKHDVQKYAVNQAVKEGRVPVYGILLKNISKKPNKEKVNNTKNYIFGVKIKESVRGGGAYEDCSTKKSSAKSVKKAFGAIQKRLKENTYIVTFKEQYNSNRVTANARLAIGETKFEKGFFYKDYQPDTVAPMLADIKQTSDNSIQFVITDNQTTQIRGADIKENYIVKSKDKKDSKTWVIEEVKVNPLEDSYELVFKNNLYTGGYTLECNNITDISQEQNVLSETFDFSFQGIDREKENRERFIKSYWWIALIVLVVIIGIVLIIIVKLKPGKVVEIEKGDTFEADTKLIRLTITDRAGTVKDIEWNVEGSIFIGRSANTCNIYFDDDRLSRQHFVIEVTKMACYIEDLQTTNATFVNGVKIGGRRMLLDGDIITAGREKFVFHTVGDGGGNAE